MMKHRTLQSQIETLETLAFEPDVNCHTCKPENGLNRHKEYSPESKCCDFRPFLSAFRAGEILSLSYGRALFIELRDRFEFLPVGVVHSFQERMEMVSGRPISQCAFFSKDKKQCRIWAQRPSTCRFFFCASAKRGGLSFYQKLERMSLAMESQLLKKFYFSQGGNEESWLEMVAYLDEKPQGSLELGSFADYEESYKNAYQWLSEMRDGTGTGPAARN